MVEIWLQLAAFPTRNRGLGRSRDARKGNLRDLEDMFTDMLDWLHEPYIYVVVFLRQENYVIGYLLGIMQFRIFAP